MSSSSESRISYALRQLTVRDPTGRLGDDRAAAEKRFQRALDIIDEEEVSRVIPDVNHISDLVKERLSRRFDTVEASHRYSNLLSRLLAQPVLSQKWAILYLLYKVSELEDEPASAGMHRNHGVDGRDHDRVGANTSHQQGQSTRVIDEAFGRSGLSTLGSQQESRVDVKQLRMHPPVVRTTNQLDTNGLQPHSPQLSQVGDWKTNIQPSEASLLRDLPYTLQGISSTSMSFVTSSTLKLPPTLPSPIISLLHTLAEPSLLYKSLAAFVESLDGGLIGQSLRSAIDKELRSYLGLVASLETQIRRALATLENAPSQRGLGKVGVTLRRCVIWVRDATLGLRLMTSIVEESRTRKGGQLLSLIHSYSSSHGDPFIATFADRMLAHVSRPFYDMLRLWIYDGELSDPYREFFVTENLIDTDEDALQGATTVWETKYKLDAAMLPSIITEELAKKVFLTGKSLNFIRYGCGDSAWAEDYSRTTSRQLRYGATAELLTSIDEAYNTTVSRLTHLMNNKFKLFEHLKALKKYLLLGQGDFVDLLMESLASNLDRPANSQYRHTLTAQLEHAIRNSNAQHDSADVLRRLDARMLELSHGEIGWDVFTLEYKVDAPVDVIVTPHGSKQYLKVFNFLWRIKRVEFALSSTWRRCMTGARGVLASVDDKVGRDWKVARCTMAEMVHFINQLQYYILFEVIEASWTQLQKEISKSDCTLDELIEAHAKYLKSITKKGLLGSSTFEFTSQLHEILKTMLSYKDAVDGLYSYSVAEYTRRQDKSQQIENRTARGKWGITEKDDIENIDLPSSATNKTLPRSRDIDSPLPPPLLAIGGDIKSDQASVLPALRVRLTDLSADFRTRTSSLLGDLAYQPDPDMRFLGVVMNFNDTYKVVRRARRKNAAPTATVEKRKEPSGRD